MNLNLKKTLFAAAILLLALIPLKLSADIAEYEYAEGRIIVKLAKTPQSSQKSISSASTAEIAGMKIEKNWNLSSQSTYKNTANSISSSEGREYGGTIALLTSKTMSTEQMLDAAAKNSSIEYAEPDYRIYPTALPNDPAFNEQWAYSNRISSPAGGTADINIQKAWDRVNKSLSDDVIVAVVDMGVDYEHPV